VRESILAPFAVLVLWALVWGWKRYGLGAVKYGVAMAAGLTLIVIPWTIRNYVVTHEFVPISIISMVLIGAGNNDCVAAESFGTPFYGDNPCPVLDAERAQLLVNEHKPANLVNESRAYATLGWRFIFGHPGEYLELCARRAWTTFDPWHEKQHLVGAKKLIMLVYFLLFVYTGLFGAVWAARSGHLSFGALTLYILLLISYAPLVAIFVSHDHRFAIGIHLMLACFAGVWMAHFQGIRGLFPASWQVRNTVE